MAKSRLASFQGSKDPAAIIGVSIDLSELGKLQNLFPAIRTAIAQAVKRSLSRTVNAGASQAARMFVEAYTRLKLSDVKGARFKASVKAPSDDVTTMAGLVSISGKGIVLDKLKPKKTKTGVIVPKRFGKPWVIEGAFYAKVFKTNKGPSWWKREGKSRFPVILLTAKSPAYVFREKEKPNEKLRTYLRERFMTEIGPNLGFYVDAAVFKAGLKSKALRDAIKKI